MCIHTSQLPVLQQHVTRPFTKTTSTAAVQHTSPPYTSVNRQRRPENVVVNLDWHSSIYSASPYDTESVLNSLQFQTKLKNYAPIEQQEYPPPQAPQKNNHPEHVAQNNNIIPGDASFVVKDDEEWETNNDSLTTTTPKHTTDPIKLIFTTSGATAAAAGQENYNHYEQQQPHNYPGIMTGPDNSYVYAVIQEEAEEGDGGQEGTAYDDLGNNLDLGSLLAHHEAGLDDIDMDVVTQSANLSDTITTTGWAGEGVGSVDGADQGQEKDNDDDEPIVVEIMSDIMGMIVGGKGSGGVGGSNTVAQFHNDEVGETEQQQRESTTVKVSSSS